MAASLKPLKEQVIVITGASSGIGLTTARMAASKGAKLVVAARSGESLQQLEQELSAAGTPAVAVTADVGKQDDVERIFTTAVDRFGGFDTWFNNAGVGIYGTTEETSIEDARRLFETNFWGEVYGSLAAIRHLKARGGALINMGSIESDRAVPLHSMYSASKHAVQGFTHALRMELEKEGAPVSVTLIKPGPIDTPFIDHAKNYMAKEPNFPPPVYAPEVVARAVLHAAVHPEREIWIGGGGKLMAVSGKRAPRLTDRWMEATMFGAQQKDEPSPPGRRDALHSASDGGLHQSGSYSGHVARISLYTQASLHPLLTAMVVGVAGAALAGALGATGKTRPRGRLAQMFS